jgi:hypothetical protein
MNAPALLAAGAASVSVWAHGVVGQRWFVGQLSHVEFRPTKPWGDADVTRLVFAVVWHIVTALFFASAVTLFLAAFEVVESRELLRFISIAYAASLGVGLFYLGRRPDALRRPFGAVVVACLVAVSVLAWLAQARK